jgi:hypothetical protein
MTRQKKTLGETPPYHQFSIFDILDQPAIEKKITTLERKEYLNWWERRELNRLLTKLMTERKIKAMLKTTKTQTQTKEDTIMPTSFTPPVPNFLSAEDKKKLSDSGEVFEIIGIATGPGKYGKTHTYTLRLASAREPVYMSLTGNPRRDIEAEYMAGVLEHDTIGPVVLAHASTEKGSDAWYFEDATKPVKK